MTTENGSGGPPRRLRHRIPVSLRQHWPLVAVFSAFVLVAATVFGSTRVRPYITGNASVIASDITENIAGTVDFFDAEQDHTVNLDFSQSDYDRMIAAYQDEGEKEWITADVTVDGTLITDVGVRLKGNSTLMGLRGGTEGPGGVQMPELPEGMELPEELELPDGMGLPEGMEIPEGFAPPGGGGPGGMVSLSADDPTSLPLLIRFDKFVEGRAYQGMTELSVRPGSPVLNEATALSLTAESGQATQRYSYATYSVNGGATQTRLLLEHPDDGYANSLFDDPGVLYKADANSSFTYQGDDQTTYADQFTQVNGQGSQDLQPIISFLKWMDGASDDEFAAHLSDHVDVESFARYVATQNLLVNSDDMAGPGRNYYLWYDLGTKKLTVVSWDLNLALSSNSTAGPHDSIGMGGMGGPPGAATTDVPTADTAGEPQQRGPRMGGQRQEQGGPVQQGGPGRQGAPAMGGGGMRSGNALKERFLASGAFTGIYENAYRELYEQLFASGRAIEILDEIADSVPTSDSLTADALAEQVETLRTRLQARTDALADHEVIVG
ncbi:spore coat protein CotH [Prescottella equi]|uniref:CotH kinase family protein n=1 Tax=Rhodococcus hoagii TaxID=43767 RepID=UPI000A117F59|nr:CotH kinase family protein [Prescottella equi]ORL88585.1 spore coat protein CotH [Prescottella equi]ORM16402.1 spore coat protein CotH [Prescottella equi]